MEDRRSYMTKMASEMAPSGLGLGLIQMNAKEVLMKNIFVHHVFFWLKEPKNSDACNEFLKGLRALLQVQQIQSYHIGAPVQSSREVVDDSFTYSYMAFFKNMEDQAIYQTHPIHLKFIEDCQHLWEKIIVYDAMD